MNDSLEPTILHITFHLYLEISLEIRITMSQPFQAALDLLTSHAKIDRDKGALALKVILKQSNSEDTGKTLAETLVSYLKTMDEERVTWETVFGYLEASRILIESENFDKKFSDDMLAFGLHYLEHNEFRVRIVSGTLLGSLCRTINSNIYKQCESVLVKSIRTNLKRDIPPDTVDDHAKAAKEIFHDTAGWKCLETSMKGLQAIIEGCAESFFEYVGTDLLEMLFETLNHTNRFVRETGYYLCASLARYGVSSRDGTNLDIAEKLAHHLRIGLTDNWSQVRLAASVATRQFFEDLNDNDKTLYFRVLLPPMCLNRYYLAEGVKLYNQESWRQILGSEGRANVALYIKEIVEFYVVQTESDNHAVREAACHCMAELSSKIDHDIVRTHVPVLLNSLHYCFQDESWPVRDTACVACGNFILNFPDECKSLIDELYPLFFGNLHDPIPSVRQGAAVALTNVAKAYGEPALEIIFEKITEAFEGINAQQASSERYEGLDKGTATYGVIKQLHDNDMELHSNQQMYSCGSLAPKMGRARGGGCMDHSFKRASEPWEAADGCVYLLSELVSYPEAVDRVKEYIPHMLAVTEHKHYAHHLHLFETLNKVTPVIAKGLTKRIFKQYLEQFLNVVFYSLACENALTKSAAVECLQFLNNFVGASILRGRIEQYNPTYMRLLNENLGRNV